MMLALLLSKLVSYCMSLQIPCLRSPCLVNELVSGSLSFSMVANPALNRSAVIIRFYFSAFRAAPG